MSLTGPNEEIRRLIEGEESAITAFVSRHQASVRGFTAMWAPSADEADDIAQEVFLAALRSMDRFSPDRDMKSWLLGIARNLTRQAWRRAARLPESVGPESLDAILEHHALTLHREREAVENDRLAALRRCIGSLPENLGAIFQEYVVEGASSAELGELLKTTAASARALISRIRRDLRACIERRLQTEPS